MKNFTTTELLRISKCTPYVIAENRTITKYGDTVIFVLIENNDDEDEGIFPVAFDGKHNKLCIKAETNGKNIDLAGITERLEWILNACMGEEE